ncbi:TonB-dependent receptor [Brevundimonas goettingensis]|uniref:TonB-dependent receptor n=1 Tax=Brevundimonas goettingensis TaxID=2774190 RepID=A0A975C164_9CAUL|nr:TonB-dependent receptor [Brevundimonas goettingensis]QTC91948.1 TonB-dependent receptor [Brevundimonas goettingensis]
MKAWLGRKGLMLGVSVVALASAPAAVWAQNATPAAQDAQATTVDDIIVSAQRRDQNKQDVPVTVTVLGGEQIDEARIQTVQDVVGRTPGLQFDAYPASEPRLSVRGVSSSDRGAAGDPSSAVFVDEVYYGRPAAINFDSFDLQRIEVLKGPQGTLFGRNVVGGAVNVVTNRPDLNSFEAAAEGSLGNFNSRDLAGMINLPFADGKAAVRIGVSIHQHDGYVDRIVDGGKEGEVDDQDSQSARIQLRAEPVETFRLNLTVDYARDRANGPSNRALYDDGSGALSGLYVINWDRDFNNSTFDGQQDRDTWGVRAKAEWDLPFATLSYLGAYRDLDYFALYDFDGSATPTGLPEGLGGISGGTDEQSKIDSHELQLKSLPDSTLTWVLGLYRYHGETRRTASSLLDFEDLFGLVIDEYITQDNETVSTAVYGDITWPVTEKLNVFGGARYTRDEKDIVSTGLSNVPGTFNVNDEYTNVAAGDDWGAATWRIGADYHFSPDVMGYGSVSRGFKSGGFQESPGDSAEAVVPYDPEFITNYELGIRTQFLDRTVTLNASVYLANYTDLQVRIPSGTGLKTANAGEARIEGLETEFGWNPGNGFSVNATYAYTHARFTDYTTIESGVSVDYSGNHLTRIPDHKFTLSPAYAFNLASGAEIKVAADYVYESKIYDDQSNLPPEIRDPTSFLDARVIYTDPMDRWSFSVWGKNLTDEQTKTYEGTFAGVTFGSFNPPPTYGVTLRYNY